MINDKQIKITVVVNGKFHAFDYAAELNRQGKLHRLISSMPRSVASKYGITGKVYVGLPIFELIKKFPQKILKKPVSALWYSKQFSKMALRFIPEDSDIIITSAGCSEEIYKSEKLKRIPKVLDRGSTHTLSNIVFNKLAADFHHTEWHQHPDDFLERELTEYRLADKILVPSSFVERSFVENGISKEKIIKIPYGISQYKFKGLQAPDTGRQPAVLFVGQISARKGIGVLIKSIEIVRKTNPNVELWLVGAKNNAISNSLLDKEWIKYFGVLRGQDLFDKYKSAAVFCLTSFEEGLALVLTEATNCGLPIVATTNTGAEDIIDNGVNGFVVPVGNPDITAEKLIEILDNKNEWWKQVMDNPNKSTTWGQFCDDLLLHLYQIVEQSNKN